MAEIKTKKLDSYLRLIDIARDLASTLDLDVLLDRIVNAAAAGGRLSTGAALPRAPKVVAFILNWRLAIAFL